MSKMYIMIAGPYTEGSTNRDKWKSNHKKLNEFGYKVHLKGHIPIIGVNVALPIIETVGFDKFDELMMPISLAIAQKCDAVLRVGGYSIGADKEVDIFKNRGLPIYYNLDDIPNSNS